MGVRCPSDAPVYVSSSTPKDASSLVVTDSLTVGVKEYHTVPWGASSKQVGAGSPDSTVAAVRSTLSLNGSAPIWVALAKLSLAGGWGAVRLKASCPPD